MNPTSYPPMHAKQASPGHPGRIVLFVRVFPRRSETFIVQKFLGLLERGWDVHIVCNRSTAEDRRLFPQLPDWKELRHHVHVTRPARTKILEALLLPFSFVRGLLLAPKSTLQYFRRGWKRFGPYILHLFYLDTEFIVLQPALIHYEFSTLATGHMYQKDLLNCRITVSFRGSDLNIARLDKPDFYRQIWEQADALHLVSEDLWRQAQKQGCPSDKPHRVIFPAIDTSFFARDTIKRVESIGTPVRPYRILSVGRLDWVKGYEYALQAVKWLVVQGIACEYHIIGEGAYSDAIRFTIRDLELENIAILLGPKSRSEVKEHLERTDVFLLASVSEGLSNAVLEAQAMSLPVVCTDAGDVGIANEETGFIIPRRDWRSMAEKLALLAADSNLRVRMGEAGRQRVLINFHVGAQIEGFHQFYCQVLS
jgi:colanic acid/amylovoran biosynthesis glycosyltransferase